MYAIARRALSLLPLLLAPTLLPADPIPVRHSQGTYHGFLILRSDSGAQLAVGDLVEVAHGSRVTSRLTFHFRDGSLDDEQATFTQNGHFVLLHDRHVQRGPSFPHPVDVDIDVPSGQVTTRTPGSKAPLSTEHMDLPPDLANGLPFVILTNIAPTTPETRIPLLVPADKPRLVHLLITPDGTDPLTIAGSHRTANRFRVHYDLGGLTGMLAGVFGKQPDDLIVSILDGEAPAFMRFSGQFFQGGPTWHVAQVSPTFSTAQ